jgi:hypothetical protein
MKLLSLIFFTLMFLISSCDNSTPTTVKKEGKQPWGKWLPPDAKHPEKRLEVKFGRVLYQIPVSYLSGDQNIKGSPWSVKITATYPDLVPWQKASELKMPHEPNIYIILGGHKDDHDGIDNPNSYKQESYSKEEPYPEVYANDIKQCPIATNSLAKGMIQYTCNVKSGQLYFTPLDTTIRTPIGYKVFIGCTNALPAVGGLNAKYECIIHSRIFDDGRGAISRIHLNDLADLLDAYRKSLQLLTSLEAPKQ